MQIVLVLEFGDGIIRFVEGAAIKDSHKVISHGCIELQPGILDDGVIKDLNKVKELLEGALSEHGVKSRKVVFLINSNAVLIRKIELPYVKSCKETAKMLSYNLQELLPSFIYQYKSMFRTIDRYNSNGVKKATHVVYGINRKMYDQYKNLAGSLNMDLKSLDVSANCICRIDETKDITVTGRDKYAANAFICLEKNGASLCISKNGTAVFHKNFKSVNSPDECVNEVLKCFRFYKSSNKDITIAAIYVYGEAADEKTRAKLRYELETSAEKIKDLPVLSDGIFHETDIYKFINLLTSLKTYKKDKNFLSDEKNLRKFRFNAAVVVMSLCVTVLAVIAYLGVDRVLRNEIKESQLNAMNMFVSNEDNIAASRHISEVRSRIDYLEEYYKESLKIKSESGEDRLICSDLFETIRSCAPEGTKIKSIYSDSFTSVVSCSSDSLKGVTLFAANLRNVDFIEDINISDIKISRDTHEPGCDYQVTCILKGVENEGQ